MDVLSGIRLKISTRSYELSKHAVDQSLLRDISIAELEEVLLLGGELIENYPNDKYGPSCLILGFTTKNRALHVQCSYPERPLVKIITLYEPNPIPWVEYRTRRD